MSKNCGWSWVGVSNIRIFSESLAAAKNDVTLHNFLYLRLQASLKHFVRLKWARKVWQIRGHKIQQKSRTQRQISKIHFKLSIKMMASMKRFSSILLNFVHFYTFFSIFSVPQFFHFFNLFIYRFCWEFLRICWESAEKLLRIADKLLRICWGLLRICWEIVDDCWEIVEDFLRFAENCWESAANLLRIAEKLLRIC